MPTVESHRNRLRRLRVLQALYNNRPDELGDGILLQILKQDSDLSSDKSSIRQSLDYLAQRQLCTLNIGSSIWIAKITYKGIEYIEGDDPGWDGISHPAEFMS